MTMTTPPQHGSDLPAPVPASGKASTESTIAAGLGIAGMVLTLFSCCCGLLMLLSVPVGLAGLVLGYLEHEKVKRGEIDAASDTWAMVGMAAGACTALFALVSGVMFFIGVGGGALQQLFAQLKNR